jgi:hypothetical protein
MEKLKQIVEENNQLLKEIKSMLTHLLSPGHMQQQEATNLLTNVIANLLVWKQNRM